ncbi:unnamed protein product [Rhizophagus irregularis]|nr:unnamed protein product [Rhizophagus irregularis]
MTSIFHSGLSKDFSSILNDADDYNVIIQVDKNHNIKEFRAHSVILRARSRYFKSALSSEWITKKNNMIIFNKPNINSTVFDIILRPYKDIIPNKIYKEIEEFYNKGTFPKITTLPALPPRTGKIDSKIIKQNLVKIILKWINKEDYWTSRYKFDLIYRGSIDGICTESFKNKCKGQIESLVLIKVKQTNRIFGGYSSIGFNSIGDNLLSIYNGSQRFYYSSNNFIFSFENDEDTQNMRISRVINYDKAIYDHPNVGFDFGYNSLFIDNCQCLRAHNLDFNYENNLTTYEIYNIEEIETFIITKQ